MINEITFPDTATDNPLHNGIFKNKEFLSLLGINGYSQFDSEQRKQIRLGLLDVLDISSYAHKEIPAKKMEQMRLRILNKKVK